MVRGINKVILLGNVGQEPVLRYTPEGKAIATISLATSTVWKDKETDAKQEKTEWHKVVFFAPLSEVIGEYVKKGARIYLEGSVKTKKWTDKNNVTRYDTFIHARDLLLLTAKPQQATQAATNAPPAQEAQEKQVPIQMDDIPF